MRNTNTDWYINQLRRSYYDSGAFKLTLDQNDYRQYGPKDVLYVDEIVRGSIDVSEYLNLLKEGHPALTRYARDGEAYHILPSKTLSLSVKDDASQDPPLPPMQIHVSGSYLGKNALAILDLIVSNGWTRPVYFNFTSMNTLGLNLQAYLVQEGPVYRLTPQRHAGPDIYVDTERAWENLVEKADYSNLRDSRVLFNYEDYYSRMLIPVRQLFNTLARSFLEKGDTVMTERVLNAAMTKLYAPHLRPSYNNIDAAGIALAINKKELSQFFSTAAFNYYSRQVEDARASRREPDQLDSYLLDASSKLLVASGR